MPQNMPGYIGPRVYWAPAGSTDAIAAFTTDVVDPYCTPILSSSFIDKSHGHSHCLGNVPIRFNILTKTLTTTGKVLLVNEISQVSRSSSSFSWAIYDLILGISFPQWPLIRCHLTLSCSGRLGNGFNPHKVDLEKVGWVRVGWGLFGGVPHKPQPTLTYPQGIFKTLSGNLGSWFMDPYFNTTGRNMKKLG